MRRALVIAMVAVVAVVLFAQDIPLAAHLRQVERDRLVTSLERDAFVIAGIAENDIHDQPDSVASDDGAPTGSELRPETPDASPDVGGDLQTMIERYQRAENVRVVIVDHTGTVILTSDRSDVGDDYANRTEIVDALNGQPAAGSRYSKTLDADLFYVAVPVFSAEGPVGAVRLTALNDEVSQRASRRVRGIFVVAGLSLVMAIAVAWVVASRLSKPIETLRRTTQRVADGDLSARARADEGPPEVRALAESLNAMTTRLSLLIDRQRSFAGTASHQLRTPLTALRLRLEALDGELDPTSSAGQSVDAALAETDRLHRMIEGLLALARAEGSSAVPEATTLGELALERVEHWSPLAEENGVVIDGSGVDRTVVVDAIPGAIEQILDNLIDNALDAVPSGSVLRIETRVGVPSLESLGSDPRVELIELHVIDDGPGLDDDQRERAFERFWRGSGSTPGGTGLGLAVVRQLAEASGAAAELRRSSTGGVDATVTFRRSARRA